MYIRSLFSELSRMDTDKYDQTQIRFLTRISRIMKRGASRKSIHALAKKDACYFQKGRMLFP